MKQQQFLEVCERDEAERRFRRAVGELPTPKRESVPLDQALGRVLAEDVVAKCDVPGFDRSNMDGWAVRAADTHGATEATPRRLKRAASAVAIGTLPDAELGAGEAMSIPTGGPLPRGADAVVMVEVSEPVRDADGSELVEIRRAVTAGTALSFTGTDIARGETVLRAGQRLSSRELGVLAAVGLSEVAVRRLPRVAILSTGDELRAAGQTLAPGQLYDTNGPMLAGAVREQGGEPVALGIAPDDPQALEATLRRAIAEQDLVLLSGGTSKGPGDLNVAALEAVSEPPGIVVHGVALKPGKPLCLAVSGHTPVAILPGFPTSAIFTFHELVAPLLRRLAGLDAPPATTTEARLPHRFRSDPGRTECSLVHLVRSDGGELLAYPIGKGSGSVTTWSGADGYFVVPRRTEQLEAGERLVVRALGGTHAQHADLVIVGSHCVGLDLLVSRLTERGFRCKLVTVGSEAGLQAARHGACDLAPIHLLDAASGSYNRPFIGEGLDLIEGYCRLQGLVYRPGDARFEGRQVRELMRDIATTGARMVNRNAGSGTRLLSDALLGGSRPAGYQIEARSHHAVAAAVEQGRADFGIAIDVVARDRALGFSPIAEERFDFAVPASRRTLPAIEAFCRLLAEPATRDALRRRGLRP